MPHDHEHHGTDETIPPRRRSADSGFAKYASQVAMSVLGGLLLAAILWLFSLSSKITRLEVGEHVSKADFVALQEKLEALREAGKERHDTYDRDLERLRQWMRGHNHGGARRPNEDPAEAAP